MQNQKPPRNGIDFHNRFIDPNDERRELAPRPGKHVVEVNGVEGRWIVYAFGTLEQCETTAKRYRSNFGGEARVKKHGEP